MGLDTGPKIYRKHGTQPKLGSELAAGSTGLELE
jgi:hypothetical protein